MEEMVEEGGVYEMSMPSSEVKDTFFMALVIMRPGRILASSALGMCCVRDPRRSCQERRLLEYLINLQSSAVVQSWRPV